MALAFTPEQLIGYGSVITAVGIAWGTMRTQISDLKDRVKSIEVTHMTDVKDRVKTIEAEVNELKESQLAVALLEQAVASLDATAKEMHQESRTTRVTLELVGRSLVRIETKIGLESAPHPAA